MTGTGVDALEEEFALCLTHDVDRPFKHAVQAVYYGLVERRPHHFLDLLPGRNPYWQFEEIQAIESDLGVRSAFYFLDTPPLWNDPLLEWLDARRVIEHLGRYDPDQPAIADAIRRLEAGGWEVGLHASLQAAGDADRLATEYERLQSVVSGDVVGCRQHHLRVAPETLANQAAVGLEYDASMGSSTQYGFQAGDDVRRPVPDGPVEFPLTLMEVALPDPGTEYAAALAACERLLRTARERGALMTVLWHPRCFSERDFPGYRRLYRELVARALEMDAWVGPPRDLLARLEAADAIPEAADDQVPDRGPDDGASSGDSGSWLLDRSFTTDL